MAAQHTTTSSLIGVWGGLVEKGAAQGLVELHTARSELTYSQNKDPDWIYVVRLSQEQRRCECYLGIRGLSISPQVTSDLLPLHK